MSLSLEFNFRSLLKLNSRLAASSKDMRKIPFANDEYYHVFNRGVEKREVFCDLADYERFLLSLRLMNSDDSGLMIRWRDFHEANPDVSLDEFLGSGESFSAPSLLKFNSRDSLELNVREAHEQARLVDILAYCLNPNHYHLVLRQRIDKGIEKFMQKVGTGYTNYFNAKYERSGALFQGRFKASHIDSDEYLLHVLAYVDANSSVHGVAEAESYPWCSYSAPFGGLASKSTDGAVISGRMDVLSRFSDILAYHDFARSAVEGMRDRKELEK